MFASRTSYVHSEHCSHAIMPQQLDENIMHYVAWCCTIDHKSKKSTGKVRVCVCVRRRVCMHIHCTHITTGILLKAIVCLDNKSRYSCAYNIICGIHVNDSMNTCEQQLQQQQWKHIKHILTEHVFQLNVQAIDAVIVDTIKSNTMTGTMRPRIQSPIDFISCFFILQLMNTHIFLDQYYQCQVFTSLIYL